VGAVKVIMSLVIVLACQAVRAEGFPRVTADLAAYDAHMAAVDAEFAKRAVDPHERNWVKSKLAHMVNVDQYTRRFAMTPSTSGYSAAEKADFEQRFGSRFDQVDSRNTADLKQLLEIHGWFTISRFGGEADTAAWLLVQHADQDRAFQRRVLTMLEPLVKKGETRSEQYAYLYDRVTRPQRYGTQGHCIGKGRWEPFEIEDPARLDERRASVGLPSEAEYQAQFKNLCFESQQGADQATGPAKP
jgi:hypothetical protein